MPNLTDLLQGFRQERGDREKPSEMPPVNANLVKSVSRDEMRRLDEFLEILKSHAETGTSGDRPISVEGLRPLVDRVPSRASANQSLSGDERQRLDQFVAVLSQHVGEARLNDQSIPSEARSSIVANVDPRQEGVTPCSTSRAVDEPGSAGTRRLEIIEVGKSRDQGLLSSLLPSSVPMRTAKAVAAILLLAIAIGAISVQFDWTWPVADVPVAANTTIANAGNESSWGATVFVLKLDTDFARFGVRVEATGQAPN